MTHKARESQIGEKKPISASAVHTVTVAVVGNPNSGKSTLINALAGSKLQVGNWPGVTVEKREAVLEAFGSRLRLVDLPGSYSLSPYTEEEGIARDFLVHEKPDVILNVVDATNLERNLYFTVQLLEFGIPTVIALNMYDEAQKKGFRIDTKTIEKRIGVQVVPTVATKKIGISELLKAVCQTGSSPESNTPCTLHYSKDIDGAKESIIDCIKKKDPPVAERYPVTWLAYKVLEGDQGAIGKLALKPEIFSANGAIRHLKSAHDTDVGSWIADMRYAQASGLTKEVVTRPLIKKIEITECIDQVVLNRYAGIPVFLAIIWLMFKLTFDLSAPFVDWIDMVFTGPLTRWISAMLQAINASDWIVSLLIEGVIGGVGFVLVFVPVIATMMFLITFLEGCGYMARAAFVMDRYMHMIGLHGKSFIPMLLGFGCNVPGVYATRTLENTKDKALTTLLLPLMTCGARLPVYILFISVFFKSRSGEVLLSIYLLGIFLAIVAGFAFQKLMFRDKAPIFIMELPPYRMPSWNNLMIHTWEKTRHFVMKAGTTILAMSVIVWFALNMPWGVKQKKESYMGQAALAISPIFKPLGFGTWEATSSLLTGIVAKEIIISTMGEVFTQQPAELTADQPVSVGEEVRGIVVSFMAACHDAVGNLFSTVGIASIATDEMKESKSLRDVIRSEFTPLSAYSFMVFTLLYMPCIVTGIAIKHEFGSWKLFMLATVYGMSLAWIVSFLIYQVGSLLKIGV